MIFDRSHFHFFGNREMNSLYFTIALLYFAEGLISIFVPIYFWQIGFPLWRILLFSLLSSFFFVVSAFLMLPIVKKLSDKMMMFLSIPFLIVYYLGLTYIANAPILFYILPFVLAINRLLFNVGYNMDFSGSADDGKIGREVGTRYMVGALAQFSAPLLGGFLISIFGFRNNFIIGTFILMLAILPLFFFPKRNFSSHLNGKLIIDFLISKKLRDFNLSGIGYATEATISRIVWPLFIFIALGSIQQFGGIISAGLLAGAVVTYLVGFLSDVGRRRKVLAWSAGIFSLIWLLRPFFMNPFMIIGSHVGGNLANASLMVSWGSQYYKLARAVSHHGLFILSREILYHLSRIFFLPILIVLAYAFSQEVFFRASFILAAFLTLMFLFANRTHTRDLRGL